VTRDLWRSGALAIPVTPQKRGHCDADFKRLEKGTFRFPEATGGRVEVTPAEMAAVLEGIDLSRARRLPRFAPPVPQPA
jgi:IS66 Orf2 like protein